MAYKLLDQNGNYMEINGMHKGTILSPYEYQGMELYNENAIASNKTPFYDSFFGARRIVRVGSSYYVPSGTKKEYVDEAYVATEIAINGRYSSSSYKDYEVYKDGNLVASGSFTNSDTDIYVCQKEANTSIIVRGIWDEANSKFIYNITTNATIERNHNYEWNNGMVTTSSIELPKIERTPAVTEQYIPRSITMPTRADIEAMLPSDCIIIDIPSVSYLLTFYKIASNPDYYQDMWLRTSHSTTTINPSSLPGFSVCSVSRVGSSSPETYTLTGKSRLGETYYLYTRKYRDTGKYYGNNTLCSVTCVATATVKYRYFEEVHTVKVNVTRTNSHELPAYSLAQVKKFLPSFGTSTIDRFKYYFTIKNNASSGTYTYYKIMEGSKVKSSGSISLGTTKIISYTYTENMPSILALQISAASDGTYIDGSDRYISFPNEEGAHYLEIHYTWAPPE